MPRDFYGPPHVRPTLGSVVVALIVLIAVAPVLLQLLGALIPLVVIAGVVIGGVRLIWFSTRRW